MANIDLGNLTRYDGKIKEYIENKYLSKNTANWQMTEKAGAVAFYPVPKSDLEPVVDFVFTETPPAEGDKGPENPSTITGESSVNIGRVGKNLLLKVASAPSWNGLSITANADGSYTIDGTFNAANEKYFALTDCAALTSGAKSSVRLDTSKTYTISAELVSGTMSSGAAGVSFSYANTSAGSLTVGLSSAIGKDYASKSVAAYEGGQFIFRLAVNVGAVFDDAVLRFQLEEGTEATDFEPPMLPADANHAITLNGTYYGGSLDVATGVMTVTWKSKAFDGTENWQLASNVITGYSVFYYTGFYISGIREVSTATQTCTHYPVLGNLISVSNHFYVSVNRTWFVSTEQSVNDFKAFLAQQNSLGTPVTVVCKITPYIVQLDPIQIKSLTALDKNTPRLNTLYTDADSIQVGYQKHPARTSYELENAILALGGGE